jgi:heparan-alpha-glucosaminide N-acetyltransferase
LAYWGAFALYPVPASEADSTTVSASSPTPVPSSIPPSRHTPEYTGFAAHWNKNTNLAWKVDTWFLNLFPRERPFEFNGGGYSTLSFIPTLATMILGLIAGGCLRSNLKESRKLLYLFAAAVGCLAAGFALDYFGICPNVKKIWTPAWVLFSGGWCFLLLAGFHAFVDLWKGRIVVFPLIVIGANSIAAYCMDNWFPGFFRSAFKTHLGQDCFKLFGETYQPMVQGAAVILALWLVLFWMYRHKVFVKI